MPVLLQGLRRHAVCPNWLFTFLLLSWLHELWLTRGFLTSALPSLSLDYATLFHLAAWLCYSVLYLLPVALIGWSVSAITPDRHPAGALAAYFTSVLVLLLLKADLMIYQLYAFHFNRFVWNLIFTPGGISSLGSSSATEISAVLLVMQVAAWQGIALLTARRGLLLCQARHRTIRWTAALTGGLFLIQGTVYGVSDLQHYGAVLDGSNAYPFFQRVRFRSLAGRLGYERAADASGLRLEEARSALRYPLNPVHYTEIDSAPNIIVLVAESLRWDQLSSTTMPNTWQFGTRNIRFDQHYSSGNGTREALFGMFYGLYGSYWEKFLHAGQSPLLMDRVQQLGYELDIRTSAVLTYPEFDKTLFAHVPRELMHESGDLLPPWQRDQQNMDQLLQFLRQRDPTRPFMSFFFLESSHASYSFPEEGALHTDYAREVNYMDMQEMESADDIIPLRNRYRNSAHWIDIQLGRLYQQLEDLDLLDSTLVIVTGDHGEEFMEKGAWGHNSSFVEEQIHVPLVMHLPGHDPEIINRPTSHLDIPTTLLQQLGITNAEEDYTLGRNLFDSSVRDHLVLSDWHSIGIVTPQLKYRIPYLRQQIGDWEPTDASDKPLARNESEFLIQQEQSAILETMRNFSRFTVAGQDQQP